MNIYFPCWIGIVNRFDFGSTFSLIDEVSWIMSGNDALSLNQFAPGSNNVVLSPGGIVGGVV